MTEEKSIFTPIAETLRELFVEKNKGAFQQFEEQLADDNTKRNQFNLQKSRIESHELNCAVVIERMEFCKNADFAATIYSNMKANPGGMNNPESVASQLTGHYLLKIHADDIIALAVKERDDAKAAFAAFVKENGTQLKRLGLLSD